MDRVGSLGRRNNHHYNRNSSSSNLLEGQIVKARCLRGLIRANTHMRLSSLNNFSRMVPRPRTRTICFPIHERIPTDLRHLVNSNLVGCQISKAGPAVLVALGDMVLQEQRRFDFIKISSRGMVIHERERHVPGNSKVLPPLVIIKSRRDRQEVLLLVRLSIQSCCNDQWRIIGCGRLSTLF
jgi:hypothetical protein